MTISRNRDQIDISQEVILSKLYRHYSSLPHIDRVFLEEIDPSQPYDIGHCAGFTLLAMYGIWLECHSDARAQEVKPKDDYQWFESNMRYISHMDVTVALEMKSEIDRFFSFVRFFQRPSFIFSSQLEAELLLSDTRDRQFVSEYKLTGIFSPLALSKPLHVKYGNVDRYAAVLDMIAQQHKIVIISSEKHVTGLLRHYYRYYYYDANCKTGRVSYCNLYHLSRHILQAHFKNRMFGALHFHVLDVTMAVKGQYPSPASLLTTLYASFPSSLNNDTSEEMASLNLSASSGAADLVQFYLHRLSLRGELLKQQIAGGYTGLHYAAYAGSLESVQLMMRFGLPVNVRDAYNATPLLMAVFLNRIDVVACLLAAGADPNQGTRPACTPLLIALTRRYFELFDILMSSPRLVVTAKEYERICLFAKREPWNQIVQRAKRRILSKDARVDDKAIELAQPSLVLAVDLGYKKYRPHAQHYLFTPQPRHMQRDPHCTLPGHQGKRQMR